MLSVVLSCTSWSWHAAGPCKTWTWKCLVVFWWQCNKPAHSLKMWKLVGQSAHTQIFTHAWQVLTHVYINTLSPSERVIALTGYSLSLWVLMSSCPVPPRWTVCKGHTVAFCSDRLLSQQLPERGNNNFLKDTSLHRKWSERVRKYLENGFFA